MMIHGAYRKERKSNASGRKNLESRWNWKRQPEMHSGQRKTTARLRSRAVIAEYADMMAYLQSWNYDYTYGEEGNQSDTVQKCLRDAERQMDEQIRLSTLYKAEKALMEDVPMIPLQLRKESLLLNRNLTGFETSMNLAGGGYEFLYADFK